MQGFARASEPGAFLVDTIPPLKYVPSWFPGAGFQKEAVLMRHDLEELYDVPYGFVKREMVKSPLRSMTSVPPLTSNSQSSGAVPPSFVSTYLEEKVTPTAQEEELIKAAAASLYSGEPFPRHTLVLVDANLVQSRWSRYCMQCICLDTLFLTHRVDALISGFFYPSDDPSSRHPISSAA